MFFKTVTGAQTLSLGFMSCKKDKNCVQCATYTDEEGVTYTFCVGEKDVETDAKFKAEVLYLRSEGYTVKYTEKCDK